MSGSWVYVTWHVLYVFRCSSSVVVALIVPITIVPAVVTIVVIVVVAIVNRIRRETDKNLVNFRKSVNGSTKLSSTIFTGEPG